VTDSRPFDYRIRISMEQSWQVMDQEHSCIHGIGISKLTSGSFEVICTYLSIQQ
jgi:hypothetical protein